MAARSARATRAESSRVLTTYPTVAQHSISTAAPSASPSAPMALLAGHSDTPLMFSMA